jgi:hypothetical protein
MNGDGEKLECSSSRRELKRAESRRGEDRRRLEQKLQAGIEVEGG